VFSLVAAASLYAGDYRWETWRLISARNGRLNLMLSKVLVFALVALVGMGLFLIASVLFGLSEALVFSRPVSFSISAEDLGQAALMALLSLLRIVQYAMLALLTAAITRSLLAALFVPFVIGFAQTLLGGLGIAFLGWTPTMWQTQLLLPGLAFDTLKTATTPELAESFRAAMSPDTPAPIQPAGIVVKSAISLALWTIVPLVGAIAWFQRQDLSKE
jgi:ABC-2 type transport system permease protein